MNFRNEYFQYGLLIIITFAIIAVLSYISRKALDLLIKKNSEQLKTDATNFIFLKNSLSFILYSVGIFWIFHKIPYFNSLGTALFAGAGVLAAVIGFASQKAMSNIIGGLFILIFKPFRVGDIVELSSGKKGTVEEITLRHTIIRDYEFRRVIIPNNQMSDETIINSSITDQKIRKHVDIGISYGSDINLAYQVMREIIANHKFYIDNRTELQILNNEPSIDLKVISLSDSAVIIRAYVWVGANDQGFILQCEVFKAIKERFDEVGVEIPFPHRTLVFKNDLAVTKYEN